MEEWKVIQLKEVCELIPWFAFKSSEYSNDGKDLRLLRGDNIEPGNLRWRDAKYWRDNAVENLEKYSSY